jgi:hypothetical protein
MAKRKTPLRKLQRRLNQTTFALVVAIGLIAMTTILSEPGRINVRPMAERELASVELNSLKENEPLKTASILALECSDKSEAVSWTQQIRLKGRVCESASGTSIVSSQIENMRNGYVATVFHQDKDFTTDFIQLSEGENQLIVKHTMSDGKVEQHKVVITRQ